MYKNVKKSKVFKKVQSLLKLFWNKQSLNPILNQHKSSFISCKRCQFHPLSKTIQPFILINIIHSVDKLRIFR